MPLKKDYALISLSMTSAQLSTPRDYPITMIRDILKVNTLDVISGPGKTLLSFKTILSTKIISFG